MRVIFTTKEIHAGNDVAIKVIERLQMLVPHYAKDLKAIYCPMAKLEKLAVMAPEMVKIDSEQKLVIFSIPEETSLEVISAVEEYYLDLLDIVPVVIGAIRLFNKATDRYVKHAEAIGKKFKELVKPTTA